MVALFFGQLVHLARDREREAEAQQARELRLDLLSAVSHDLKNPLGVIESLADLLLDGSAGALNAQQADLTRRIRSSTRQVITLSQNLIDAERIEAGRLVVMPRRASLAQVVDDALVVAGSASAIKGVALQAPVEPDLPLLVASTRCRWSASSPTCSATRSSSRPPAARAPERAPPARAPSCSPSPTTARAFRPRSCRGSPSAHFRGARSRGIDGSGLGLFIVRAVVEAHGGTLRIASSVGEGTAVTVALPVEPPPEMAAATSAPTPAPPLLLARGRA